MRVAANLYAIGFERVVLMTTSTFYVVAFILSIVVSAYCAVKWSNRNQAIMLSSLSVTCILVALDVLLKGQFYVLTPLAFLGGWVICGAICTLAVVGVDSWRRAPSF